MKSKMKIIIYLILITLTSCISKHRIPTSLCKPTTYQVKDSVIYDTIVHGRITDVNVTSFSGYDKNRISLNTLAPLYLMIVHISYIITLLKSIKVGYTTT